LRVLPRHGTTLNFQMKKTFRKRDSAVAREVVIALRTFSGSFNLRVLLHLFR
jgi:hypothetical protein